MVDATALPRARFVVSESRVRLRDVVESDLQTFFEHQLDPEACRMAAFAPRDREAFMPHWAKILRDPTSLVRTVLVGEEIAGNVVSFDLSGERLVGYWIGREHWGKGVATRALALFLTHESKRPLHARAALHNVASIRVLEKCGFHLVAHERGTPDPQGSEIDEVLMRLST
jgi:RimJ/RimL family protein N-acetyltransferase